ncbi:hypothetical protein RDABS01_010274 [Bienertia sinuspersici]
MAEMNSNMEVVVNEEEKEKPRNNGGYSGYYNMLYECFEEAIKVVFRCLGFHEDSSLYSPSSTAASDATCITTTTSTTTIIEGGEEDKTCPLYISDLGGTGADPSTIGADPPLINAGSLRRMALRKPPKPMISTGRSPQTN